MIQQSYEANHRQLKHFFQRAKTDAQLDWNGKNVAVLGLSFKRDTNDTRNAPGIILFDWLKQAGAAHISAYDPFAMKMAALTHPASEFLSYEPNEEDAMKSADVIMIATDWPQFRGVADMLLSSSRTDRPVFMDGGCMLLHGYDGLSR